VGILGLWTFYFWHIYRIGVVLDRQKLLRKIKQTKSRLEEDGVSSKARRALEAELFELRVDLNYVLVRVSQKNSRARILSRLLLSASNRITQV
jgi:hypothetical protein